MLRIQPFRGKAAFHNDSGGNGFALGSGKNCLIQETLIDLFRRTNTMNKSELVAAIAEKAEMSKKRR